MKARKRKRKKRKRRKRMSKRRQGKEDEKEMSFFSQIDLLKVRDFVVWPRR